MKDNLFDKVVPKKHFKVHEGPHIHNLRALINYLPNMSQRQFEYHVNGKKNDFEKWVNQVFKDEKLAKDVKLAKRPKDLLETLLEKCKECDEKVAQQFQKEQKKKHEDDEKTFDEKKEVYADRNEELGDRFEEVAKRLQESIKDPFPKELEDLSEDLTTRYEELKTRASEIRKQGKDAFMASLYLHQFKPRLSIAKASREDWDFKRLKVLLDSAESELDESEKKEVINVKKEVLRMAGLDKDDEELKTST